MIRKLNITDLDRVMEIWLDSNIEAHDFITRDYWEKNAPTVREQLLQAEVYVFESYGDILGFVGLQDDYLAGIFVDKNFRSEGVGKELLNLVKTVHNLLTLSVYEKNSRAIAFYEREGFVVKSKSLDSETGEVEYTMTWGENNG